MLTETGPAQAPRMHSSSAIIGIPCSIYPDSWYTPANGNAISYLRALEAAGGIPALIHLTRDAEVIEAHYLFGLEYSQIHAVIHPRGSCTRSPSSGTAR